MIANPFLSRDKHFVSGTWSQSCTEVQRLWQTPEEAAEAAGLGCPQAQSPWTPTALLIRSLWSVAGDYDQHWDGQQCKAPPRLWKNHQVLPQAADLVLLNQGTFLCSWTTQILRCVQCLASWGCYEEEDLIRLDKGHGSFCCCSNVLFLRVHLCFQASLPLFWSKESNFFLSSHPTYFSLSRITNKCRRKALRSADSLQPRLLFWSSPKPCQS